MYFLSSLITKVLHFGNGIFNIDTHILLKCSYEPERIRNNHKTFLTRLIAVAMSRRYPLLPSAARSLSFYFIRPCAIWVTVCRSTFISSKNGFAAYTFFDLITVFSYSINPSFLRSPSASHSMNISIQSYMGKPVIAHSYHMPKKFQTPLLDSLENVVLPF